MSKGAKTQKKVERINFPDILKPSAEDIKMMVACRVHIGAQNLNFAMEEYVYDRGNNNECIFNLMKTWEKLSLAARVIAGICKETPSDVVAVAEIHTLPSCCRKIHTRIIHKSNPKEIHGTKIDHCFRSIS